MKTFKLDGSIKIKEQNQSKPKKFKTLKAVNNMVNPKKESWQQTNTRLVSMLRKTSNKKLYNDITYKRKQILNIMSVFSNKDVTNTLFKYLDYTRFKGIEDKTVMEYKNLLRGMKKAGIKSENIIDERLQINKMFQSNIKENVKEVTDLLKNMGVLTHNGRQLNKKMLEFLNEIGLVIGDTEHTTGPSPEEKDASDFEDSMGLNYSFKVYLNKARELLGQERNKQVDIDVLYRLYENRNEIINKFAWKNEGGFIDGQRKPNLVDIIMKEIKKDENLKQEAQDKFNVKAKKNESSSTRTFKYTPKQSSMKSQIWIDDDEIE